MICYFDVGVKEYERIQATIKNIDLDKPHPVFYHINDPAIAYLFEEKQINGYRISGSAEKDKVSTGEFDLS